MFSNPEVLNRQFGTQPNLAFVFVQRLVIEEAIDELHLFITAIDADPHPLTDPSGLVGKFNLDIITRLVACGYVVPVRVRSHGLAGSWVATR